MNRVAVARNVLIVLGANSVSFYLGIPLWAPVALALSGPLGVRDANPVFWLGAIGVILGLAASVGGVVAGWAVEAGSSTWWGGLLGAVIAVECFAREHWRVPNRQYFLGLVLEAALASSLAFAGYLIGEHLRLRKAARSSPNGLAV
jgi:hypothetical protein